MAALPYMQLYIADYLADTMHLSTEEHGAYLLLMFNYWQTGRAIPKSRLAKIARMSNERWIFVEESLREFFNDNGDEWVHDRIEMDLEAVHAKLEQRSAAGKASVAKRKAQKATKVEREVKDRSIPVEGSFEQSENENSTNKDKNKNKDIKELKDPPKSPKGDGNNKFEPINVELPEWLHRDVWVEWVEFRRQLKKPIKTPRGVAESIKRLDEFFQQGYRPEQVIRQSIANEWQGLFLPNDGFQNRNGARDVNHISQPGNEIPDGFRG